MRYFFIYFMTWTLSCDIRQEEPIAEVETTQTSIELPKIDLIISTTSPTQHTNPTWLITTSEEMTELLGKVQFRVSFDKNWDNAIASSTPEITTPNLSEGEHTLYVQYGFVNSQTWSHTFESMVIIDITPPQSPVPNISQNPVQNHKPKIQWEASNKEAIYRYDIDQEITESSLTTTASSWTSPHDLAEGVHTFYLQESDKAGNWSEVAALSFTIDTTGPQKPTVTGPPSITNTTRPVLSWTSGNGNKVFRYQLNTEDLSNAPVSKETSWTPSDHLTEGQYHFYVQEQDDAGNWSEIATASWSIDTTPPDAPNFVSFATPTTDATPSFQWESAGGAGLYRIQVDQEDLSSTTAINATTFHSPSLSDGAHSLFLQEQDTAGNWSETTRLDFVVDTTAPLFSSVIHDGEWIDSTTTSPALSWSAALDSTSDIQEYQVALGSSAGQNDIVDWTSVHTQLQHTFSNLSLTDGQTYYPSVRAIDTAGLSTTRQGDGFTSSSLTISGHTMDRTPRPGEGARIELTGSFPSGLQTSWSSSDGQFSSTATQPIASAFFINSSTSGTADFTVNITQGFKSVSYTSQITLDASRPHLNVVRNSLSGTTHNFTVTASNLANPSQYKVAVCVHADIYYCGEKSSLQNDGTLTFDHTINTVPKRAVFMLVSNTTDVTGVSGLCDNGNCSGTFDVFYDTKAHIPFALDGTNSIAYAQVYPNFQTSLHSDPQINYILNQISSLTVAGTSSDAHFAYSYEASPSIYIYDQALAIMALSKANKRTEAEMILDALYNKQNTDGSWYFSYYADGTTIYSSSSDKRPSGSIAWVIMAINTYKQAFSSNQYDAMATKALNYFETIKTTTTFNGTTHSAIPFAGVNFSGTSWNETDVASIEHNLDAYSAFHYFDTLNNTTTYTTTKNQIRALIDALWDDQNKKFHPGLTLSSGTLDPTIYLDAQTWGPLSVGFSSADQNHSYRDGLTYNCNHFFEQSGYFIDQQQTYYGFFDYRHHTTGADHKFVWSEGTLGHTLASKKHDAEFSTTTTCQSRSADNMVQMILATANARGGIPYATWSDNADFNTFASLAGSAWLYFNTINFNPFQPE